MLSMKYLVLKFAISCKSGINIQENTGNCIVGYSSTIANRTETICIQLGIVYLVMHIQSTPYILNTDISKYLYITEDSLDILPIFTIFITLQLRSSQTINKSK